MEPPSAPLPHSIPPAAARREAQLSSTGPEKRIVVGISELRVSSDPGATLVTYALGSCVAVLVHDPNRRVAGLIHFMLPDSTIASHDSQKRTSMFADLGIPRLLDEVESLGCPRGKLVVKAVGGGTLYDERGVFKIGQRNVQALHEILTSLGITIAAEDVGGTRSRTVRIHVGTGVVTVKSQGNEVTM